MRLLVCIFCIFALLLGGCYHKPVRHLVSDVGLIKAGQTTRLEVLQYLGEPDNQRKVAPGIEEYIYYEDKRSAFRRLPLINEVVDPSGFEMIVVTLSGDTVTDCVFRSYYDEDQDRMDDFSWEEVK